MTHTKLNRNSHLYLLRFQYEFASLFVTIQHDQSSPFSVWQQRRIILTKGISSDLSHQIYGLMISFVFGPDVMFIAQLNEDAVIDQIPLAEVQLVREMDNVHGVDKESKRSNDLMIETNPQGYNSGRTYNLQADTRASCQEIVLTLSQYCTDAHEKAHARTLFAQAQRQVDKVYRSALFQGFFAFLIIAVSRSCFSK